MYVLRWFATACVISIVGFSGTSIGREKITGYHPDKKFPTLPYKILSTSTNYEKSSFLMVGNIPAALLGTTIEPYRIGFHTIFATRVDGIFHEDLDTVNGSTRNSYFGKNISAATFGQSYTPGAFQETETYVPLAFENDSHLYSMFYPHWSKLQVDVSSYLEPDKEVPAACLIRASNGLATQKICAVAGNGKQLFAAVSGHESPIFGTIGSGIAVSEYRAIEKPGSDENNKVIMRFQMPVDSKLGHGKIENENDIRPVRALSLDYTSTQLWASAQEYTDRQMHDHVLLHWSPLCNKLYIGLHLQASGNNDDGVCPLLVARVTSTSQLIVEPVVDSSVLLAGDWGFAVRGAHAQACITHITSLDTSTWVHYLVFARENNRIYAYPLINRGLQESDSGKIASAYTAVEEVFNENKYHDIKNRCLDNPIKSSEELLDISHPSLCIGADVSLVGTIVDLQTDGDSVFVAVNHQDPQYAGVFQSTALFDERGMIKGWTRWQRVAGTAFNVDKFFYNPFQARLITACSKIVNAKDFQESLIDVKKFEYEKEKEDAAPKKVEKPLSELTLPENITITDLHSTSWIIPGKESSVQIPGIAQTICDELNKFFTKQNGGVIGITPLYTTKDPLLALRGNERIAFMRGTSPIHEHENGLAELAYEIAYIDKKALAGLGPITGITVVQHNNSKMLMVSGIRAVGYLTLQNDCITDADMILDELFNQTKNSQLIFKEIIREKNIREIIADEQFLYVARLEGIERIVIDPIGTIAQRTFVVKASALPGATKHSSITGCIPSGRLMIVGSTHGLYHNTMDIDVRSSGELSSHWKKIELPESVQSVGQLCAITKTGNPTDIARYTGGTLFVVTRSGSSRQSYIYRLSVNDTTLPTETPIVSIADKFVQDKPSYFIGCGWWCEQFATDGSSFLLADSSHAQKVGSNIRSIMPYANVGLNQFSPFVRRSGYKLLGARSVAIVNIPVSSHISAMIKHPTTGHWWIGSDVGLSVNC